MKYCWLLGMLLLAACQGTTDSPSTHSTPPSDMTTETNAFNYLALGDSYTIGEAVPEDERWPHQLAGQLQDRSINLEIPDIIARTGWTTGELLAAIDNATDLDSSYRLVSLLIGVNNQYRGFPLDQYERELPLLLQRALAFANGQPERVFMLSIPDYGLTPFGQTRDPEKIARELDLYNTMADSICQTYGVDFYDITKVSREYGEDSSYVAGDDLHPSGKMYTAWVREVIDRVADKF